MAAPLGQSILGLFNIAAHHLTTPIIKAPTLKNALLPLSVMSVPKVPTLEKRAIKKPKIPKAKTKPYCKVYLQHSERRLIEKKANSLGLSINAFIRNKMLSDVHINLPPPWLREALLRLYGELISQGKHLNDVVRRLNIGLTDAEAAMSSIDRHREPVFNILKQIESVLAGRKPPDVY